MKVLKELRNKMDSYLSSGKDIPFEAIGDDFKIPALPYGEYVENPIVYRIKEQEIDADTEQTMNTKKKAKTQE